jgi:hypothetical protein
MRIVTMLALLVWAGLLASGGAPLHGAAGWLSTSRAGQNSEAAVDDVYRRLEESLRRQDLLYHATIEVDADSGFMAYTGTTRQWVDPSRQVAREDAELGEWGTMATVLMEEARYTRDPEGLVTATSGRLSTCHGGGPAASFILGCPGPTEQSTTTVAEGSYEGRAVLVLRTTGAMSSSDARLTFTRELYLDPASSLPLAVEGSGEINFGQVRPTRERRSYRHEFISRDAVPADLFTPAAIGYVPPDLEAALNRTATDLPISWLGSRFPGREDLPALELQRVQIPERAFGPGYRAILVYAAADDPFGPPVVTLQLWPRADWEANLSQSRGMNAWEDPCWAREEIAIPEGTATIHAGFTTQIMRLPANAPRDCPERPHDNFLSHVYLPEVVVFASAPSAAYGSREVIHSPYDSREGMELIARALRSR